MSNFDDEHEKQELLRIASETKEIAHKVIEKGRNLTEASQFALDWAINIENFSHVAPSGFFRDPMLKHIVGGLREFNFVASRQYEQITEDESLTQIIHATATVTAVSSTSVAYISFGPKAEEIPELKSLEMLLSRSADVNGVVKSMRVLDLDIAHGGAHSPVELLRNAEEAFNRPFADEGYASAVLLPLRESIQGTIGELLKRRPTTEKTGSLANKVTSIARHCGKMSISSDHVVRVAATTHALINELSGAKDQRMNRERIAALFSQGISLLQDIVSLIDIKKLQHIKK